MAPEMVYPASYYDTLRQIVPDYFVLPEYKAQAADPLGDLAGRLLAEIDQRERLCRHLLRTQPWDLCMVVFMATDEAHHTFWSAMQAAGTDPLARHRHVIRSVYERVDQAIGALIGAARAEAGSEPTVIVLSDHGAGPFRAMINLNHWLAKAGYFAFRTDAASPVLRGSSDMLRRLALAYRRYLPARLRALIRARLGARGFDRVKGEFESALVTTAVDWGQTRAYALGVGGNVFINLREREPQGVVAPGAEYEAVCQDIIHRLSALRDPETGQAVVRRVHRREELYHGPHLDQAPDLIVEWADYAYWGRASYERPETPIFQGQRYFDFSDQPLSGCHRPQGIFIGHGPRIPAGARLAEAHLPDVTLAVLDLLNVVPVTPLDGRPAGEWLLRPSASDDPAQLVDAQPSPPGPVQDFTPEEAQLITDHLRALGYL
jgi:predicted AlkP superfamily phosphohydrolase/phosphomutase